MKRDWARLASRRGEHLDRRRITDLQDLRGRLDGSIGCGCPSLKNCALYNPGDTAASSGRGPRYLLGDGPNDDRPRNSETARCRAGGGRA